MSVRSFGLFEVFGIELEYMLVDHQTLSVKPIADQVLAAMAGFSSGDVERGAITWSNELALHVIELKTTHPVKSLAKLAGIFQEAIDDIQPILDRFGARLLPSAVHPWMDASKETRLWPHDYHQVYQAYHRIFDCHAHGWSNVQSVHLNLPFHTAEEFAQLHAAIRLVLPLLPALAASSPVLEGRLTGQLDTRISLYENHCGQVPSLTGRVIPEAIFDEATYRSQILNPLKEDIAPHDPDGDLHVDFLNARGAIARFDRGSIEIRLMDVQEFPQADIAICAAVVAVVRALCKERWLPTSEQMLVNTTLLKEILDRTSETAENAVIDDALFLRHFGIQSNSLTAGQLWRELVESLRSDDPDLTALYREVDALLSRGTLASRIVAGIRGNFTKPQLRAVYQDLSNCLAEGRPYSPVSASQIQ